MYLLYGIYTLAELIDRCSTLLWSDLFRTVPVLSNDTRAALRKYRRIARHLVTDAAVQAIADRLVRWHHDSSIIVKPSVL